MTELSPAWQSVVDAIRTRRSSPLLMPVAILALTRVANQGLLQDGRLAWVDFEKAFGEVVEQHDPSKRSEAWRPFYHLSRGVGLWTLWNGESEAGFSDLRKGKPTSVSSLTMRVDHARLREDLLSDLTQPKLRETLGRAAAGLLGT